MLIINTKKNEIDEIVRAVDENGNILYEFKIELTLDEFNNIIESMLNKDKLKTAVKIKSFKNKNLSEDEIDKVLTMMEDADKETIILIDKYCFKEHKQPFIDMCGKAKYDEMVGMIVDFLLISYTKKQTERINTTNTNLQKFMKI